VSSLFHISQLSRTTQLMRYRVEGVRVEVNPNSFIRELKHTHPDI